MHKLTIHIVLGIPTERRRDRRITSGMRLVAGHLFAGDVRRNSTRPRIFVPIGPRHIHVYSLARWHDLRLLLRLVHPAASRSTSAGCTLVPQKSQRSRLFTAAGNDSLADLETRATSGRFGCDLRHRYTAYAMAADQDSTMDLDRILALYSYCSD